MLLDCANLFMLDSRKVHRNLIIGTRDWRWTLLRRLWHSTLRNLFEIHNTIKRHTKEINWLRSLLRIEQNVELTPEFCGLDLSFFVDLVKSFYLVIEEDSFWRQLTLEGRRPHFACGRRLVKRPLFEMAALAHSGKNDFFTLVLNREDKE